jgi:hypothetical protein
MFAEIPPHVLNGVVGVAVVLLLGIGLVRLVRLESSLASMSAQRDEESRFREGEYRLWIRDREREISERCLREYRALEQSVSNLTASATDVIANFHRIFEARLGDLERAVAEGATWAHLSVGGKNVKLTGEAYTLFERCDENEQRRIRKAIAASGKEHFYKSEIQEMARSTAAT